MKPTISRSTWARRVCWAVVLGSLLAGRAEGGRPPQAAKGVAVQAAAIVLPPRPALMVTSTGPSLSVQADLPPTTERFFSLVATGDGRWMVMLAVYDGKTLAAYQYPLAIGSLPPGPTPPVPPLSGLAKVALDAAMGTVQADARKEQARALAAAIEGVLARCQPGYPGEDKITDPAFLRSAMPAAAAKALGKNNGRWIAWAEKVAVEMDRLQAAGKLADLEAYRAAYGEIIRGLKEVQ